MTFTADLRKRLRYELYECHVRPPSYRAASGWIGVCPSTVWRFLQGKPIDSDSLDLIVAYVRRKEAERAA